jgi:ABC-2 type transport system ATP-binding protein
LKSFETSTIIQISNLEKHYITHRRDAGVQAAFKSLFHRQSQIIKAVDGISFKVTQGEIVGFLGPNGAGKTTTLKMLSGLLHPTAGHLEVLGHTPFKRESSYLKRIALIMGQRNQLVWDIPAIDSFHLNRAVYRIPEKQFRSTLDGLIQMLDLADLLNKPVRNLSLGERMKCEIAGSLLHDPSVLFLDEPTIGLDVTMQRRIREFIKQYNSKTGATVLLTSHYMADVEALCRRIIVIHHGKLLFDGDLSKLVDQFSSQKTIIFKTESLHPDFSDFKDIQTTEDGRFIMKAPKNQTAFVIQKLLASIPVTDLTVEDPPIEQIIEQVFLQESP